MPIQLRFSNFLKELINHHSRTITIKSYFYIITVQTFFVKLHQTQTLFQAKGL